MARGAYRLLKMFQILQCDKSYKIFPYNSDLENGRTNYGGFDLVRHPEKISEIKEFNDKHWLRDLILHMNRPDGPLKSYGCEFVNYPTYCLGYIDFSIRDHSVANQWANYDSILKGVESRITSRYPNHSMMFFGNIRLWKAMIQEDFGWGVSGPIWKVSIECRASSQDEANNMLSSFFCAFELESSPSKTASKLNPEEGT